MSEKKAEKFVEHVRGGRRKKAMSSFHKKEKCQQPVGQEEKNIRKQQGD